MSRDDFDDLVIGAGMAGLTAAALLARRAGACSCWKRTTRPAATRTRSRWAVSLLRAGALRLQLRRRRAHPQPARRLGLARDRCAFTDSIRKASTTSSIAGDRFRIPSGLAKFRDRLIHRFPEARRPLRGYFATLMAIARRARRAARRRPLARSRHRPTALPAPAALPHLDAAAALRPRRDARAAPGHPGRAGRRLPAPARARSRFCCTSALVADYDRGAYYPDKHFGHFVDSIADAFAAQPGCDVLLETRGRPHPRRRRPRRRRATTSRRELSRRPLHLQRRSRRTAAAGRQRALPRATLASSTTSTRAARSRSTWA